MIPPKPPARPDKVSVWQYLKLFRRDILSAQPERLYGAWMAEYRTALFHSVLLNQPDLIHEVLKARPEDFPKSDRIGEGLRPLLGDAVFLTNGEQWLQQRRLIDPAFESGRLRDTFPAIYAAGEAAVARLQTRDSAVEIEAETSYAAADVIFRTLFSIPIETKIAADVFEQFRAYQRAQPLLNLGALARLPRWVPRLIPPRARRNAQAIRGLISTLTAERMRQIEQGSAPDDLATKIMTATDPKTGAKFETGEMIDQVAIFFLAGHETSASALAWALYLLATHPDWQTRVAEEAEGLSDDFSSISTLKLTRDVFREALRLYPPVPMMVRENTKPETFRKRSFKPGRLMIISPWHLHRHARLWDNPDGFDPTRWQSENGKSCMRDAFIPFSSGRRVCPGAGFAMIEGPVLLAQLIRAFRFEPVDNTQPIPVAHLTVRSQNGIFLKVEPRFT